MFSFKSRKELVLDMLDRGISEYQQSIRSTKRDIERKKAERKTEEERLAKTINEADRHRVATLIQTQEEALNSMFSMLIIMEKRKTNLEKQKVRVKLIEASVLEARITSIQCRTYSSERLQELVDALDRNLENMEVAGGMFERSMDCFGSSGASSTRTVEQIMDSTEESARLELLSSLPSPPMTSVSSASAPDPRLVEKFRSRRY